MSTYRSSADDARGPTQAVIVLRPRRSARYPRGRAPQPPSSGDLAIRTLIGVDVLLRWSGTDAAELADRLTDGCSERLHLLTIHNRGAEVWPRGCPEAVCVDHWRCRFMDTLRRRPIRHADVVALLSRLDDLGFDFVGTENLYADGGPG